MDLRLIGQIQELNVQARVPLEMIAISSLGFRTKHNVTWTLWKKGGISTTPKQTKDIEASIWIQVDIKLQDLTTLASNF